MSARCCHFQRASDTLLTTHVGKVEVETVLLLVEFAPCIDEGRLVFSSTRYKLDDVHDVVHAIHLQIVYHSRLALVLLRHN